MGIVTNPRARSQLLRQIFSIYTAVVIAAAWYGYYLGGRAPEDLAKTLSVGLTVAAIVYAIGFALTGQLRRSTSPFEVLNRDRELIRYGFVTLGRAMFVTLLVLAYVGLSGNLPPDSRITVPLATASSSSLAWLLCRIPRTFQKYVRNISGLDDEDPDLGGRWKRIIRFRREATKDLIQTRDGWRLKSHPPFIAQESGPVFVAREMAIRYGSLQAEARLHYLQLCDRPELTEAADRVDRMMLCLSEMQRLLDLEQQMRATLSSDPQSLRPLIQE